MNNERGLTLIELLIVVAVVVPSADPGLVRRARMGQRQERDERADHQQPGNRASEARQSLHGAASAGAVASRSAPLIHA